MRKKRLAAEMEFAPQRAPFSWFSKFCNDSDRASSPFSLSLIHALLLASLIHALPLASLSSTFSRSLARSQSQREIKIFRSLRDSIVENAPKWESMPTSPSSFSTTAHRVVEPSGFVGLEARMWLISDDFPAPRNPTTSVVGIFSDSGRGISRLEWREGGPGGKGKRSQFVIDDLWLSAL